MITWKSNSFSRGMAEARGRMSVMGMVFTSVYLKKRSPQVSSSQVTTCAGWKWGLSGLKMACTTEPTFGLNLTTGPRSTKLAQSPLLSVGASRCCASHSSHSASK